MFPILFESSWISLQTLWVFVVIALLMSSKIAIRRLKRRRQNFTLMIKHSSSLLLAALITSRLAYFFLNTDQYFPAFDLRTLGNLFSIWDQGFSLWGAVLGFSLALAYEVRKEEEDGWAWADALMVPLIVGLCIGNIGALLGGAAYGTPTELPWGIRYGIASVKYTVPVHPTQIYAILLMSLLLWSKHFLKDRFEFFKRSGNSSIYLTFGLSAILFALEFIRGDDTLLILGIRLPMILAGIVMLISLILFIKRLKTKDHESIQTPQT